MKQKVDDGQHLMNEFIQMTKENEEMKRNLSAAKDSLKQSSADVLRLKETCSTLIATKNTLQSDLNAANEKISKLNQTLKKNWPMKLKTMNCSRLIS